MKSRGVKSRKPSRAGDHGPILIILLSCLAVAMCFATMGLGFVSLAGSPKIPAVSHGATFAAPEQVDVQPAKEPSPGEPAKMSALEQQQKKELEDALAKVGEQAAELEQEKRKLALQQQTLVKSRSTLAGIQKQLQDMARQASEKTKGVSQAQVEMQRAKPQADAETRLADARRQLADADRRAEELRKEIHDKKTLFDPQRLFGANQGDESPQWVECVKGAVTLIPQGERIAADRLKSLSSFAKAVNGRYVVFLVRPNGFDAFGIARAAAEENGAKRLGYEPIDQNWQLKYR